MEPTENLDSISTHEPESTEYLSAIARCSMVLTKKISKVADYSTNLKDAHKASKQRWEEFHKAPQEEKETKLQSAKQATAKIGPIAKPYLKGLLEAESIQATLNRLHQDPEAVASHHSVFRPIQEK